MNNQKPVSFYKNTKDGTHCYQAALQMVLKYFLPEENYSIEDLEAMTDKVEGKWTWPQAGILNLKKKGFDVVILDSFNYEEFVERGLNYLKDAYGEEIAKEQNENSDIPQAINYVKELLQEDAEYIKSPSIEKMSKLLGEGYLVICNVNQNKLNNKEGYVGHFVVVYEVNSESILLHDPGLPAYESREVSISKFEKAWEVSKDGYAFRYKKN